MKEKTDGVRFPEPSSGIGETIHPFARSASTYYRGDRQPTARGHHQAGSYGITLRAESSSWPERQVNKSFIICILRRKHSGLLLR